MWPSLPGGSQGEWNICPLEQISRARRICPVCLSVLEEVWGTIGGFPGHEHIHPSSVVGYQCNKCNRYFTLREFLLLWKRRDRRKEFMRNYWEGVRVILRNPYLYLIVAACMVLGRGFWAGITVGIVISFLLPFLMIDRKKVLGPLGGLIRKTPLLDKPPDSPPTP